MNDECAMRRPDIGAHVLGGLEPAEAASLEAHLARCPDCRAEHANLAGLPALLAHVSVELVEAATAERGPVRSETGLRRLLDRIAAERARRRRRWRAAAAGVAAAAVLLAGVVGGTQMLDGLPAGAEVWRAANGSTDVSVTATLEPFRWGTRVDAVMNGMRPGDICLLRVVDRDGRVWDAGSWLVSQTTKDLRWTGDVGVPLERVARVEIWDAATDRRLVAATAP